MIFLVINNIGIIFENNVILRKESIMAKKKKLVMGEWSKDELKVLKKLFGNTSTKEVATKLNRKPKSVEARAYSLGLKKTKKYLKNIRYAK